MGDYMLNIIFSIMIILSVLYAVSTGNADKVTETAIISVKDTLSLTVTILSSMCVFNSMMRVLNKAGITDKLSRALKKPLGILFNKKEDEDAFGVMSMNIAANILGLGWAATPAGLEAMEALGELEDERGNDRSIASDEMCNFLIINISSLQLIPINIIAYRSQYGSVNPTRIVGAGIVATVISTFVGCMYCKIKSRKYR